MMVSALWGQGPYKDEMRSAFVTSVFNIDWPKAEHRNKPAEQQADLIRLLDQFREMNMNTIFLQVRPECDALYQSSLEPWSRYLTFGQGNDPGYDPLQFALDEAHKRGIEVHAWLNPYRINVSTNDGGSYYHETNVYVENPGWAIEYADGKKILNPGMPEVMSYIGSVVRDLLTHYMVDGIHFDDYFYSYGGTPTPLDADEYAAYGNGMELGDWRRDNVNRMIDTVYSVIQEENPSVRFGVSPFGIYRDGVPSGIYGLDAYSVIYCDPLAWLRDGTVDYLTPQTYWPTGGHQDFETLTNWWSDSVAHYGRHLYIAHGIYKMEINSAHKGSAIAEGSLHELKGYLEMNLSVLEREHLKGTGDPVAEWNLDQLGLQIDILRSNHHKNALGSVYFSTKYFDIVVGLKEYLKENRYIYPTLLPEMNWKADDTPATPQNLRIEAIGDIYYLLWDHTLAGNQRFAVYASDGETDPGTIVADPSFLLGSVFENQFPLSDQTLSQDSRLVVTTISATGRESVPSNAFPMIAGMPRANLLSPAEGATIGTDGQLTWGSDLTTPQYQFEIATTASFSNIIHTSAWSTEEVVSISSLGLDGENTYFWRVHAKEGITGPYFETRSFNTGYPAIPEITSPVTPEINVLITPTIRWNTSAATSDVTIQISENDTFDPLYTEETLPAAPGEGVLSAELVKSRWYFMRIRGSNGFGTSQFSDYVTFQTAGGEVPVAELVVPADQATVATFDYLQWSAPAAEGTVTYQLEVALTDDFSEVFYQSGWIGDEQIQVSEMELEGILGHYWRVRGKNEHGTGSYTDSRFFTTGYPTSPKLTAPPHLSDGVSSQPVVAWEADADTDSIFVEFSEEFDFSSVYYSETMDVSSGSAQIAGSLRGFTWYYCHGIAMNEYGGSPPSSPRYFETGEGTAIESDEFTLEPLKVWPSPLASGTLQISYLAKDNKPITLKVIGSLGQEVVKRVVHPQTGSMQVEITLEHRLFHTPGIYHIILSSHDHLAARSVIVY